MTEQTKQLLEELPKEDTFQTRLLKEFYELREKAWKLHDLLQAQLNCMNAYLWILGSRMKDLNIEFEK